MSRITRRRTPANPAHCRIDLYGIKLYIINGREAFHGFYPVREHALKLDGSTHSVFDLIGKDTTLFHQEASDDPDALGSQFVSQATTWFESIWTNISSEVIL